MAHRLSSTFLAALRPALAGLGLALSVSAQDLPRLDSGEAQLDWVDRRYPEADDHALRRWALERSIQYFADDPATVFRAQVRLALLDWNDGQFAAAHARLSGLVRRPSGRISRDLLAWARITDGRILAEASRPDQAAEELDEVSRDTRLTIARRSDAAAALAEILAASAPAESIDVLQDIAAIPGGDTAPVEAGLIHALLIEQKPDAVMRRLEQLGGVQDGDAQLAAVLDLASRWSLPGDGQRALLLAQLAGDSRPYPAPSVRDGIAALRGRSVSRALQARLASALALSPLAAWCQPAENDRRLPLPAFDRAIAKAEDQGQAAQCLGLELRVLSTHPAIGDFPVRVWRAAGFADWVERINPAAIDDRVVALLLETCDQLPAGSTYQIEGRLLRAQRLARAGNGAGEQGVLRDVLAYPDLPAKYLEPASRSLGASLEAAGDFAGALRIYRGAVSSAAPYGSGADCLLHALLDNLELGQLAEAARLAHVLQDLPPGTVAAASAPGEIGEFADLVNTGEAGRCWTAGAAAWPDWLRFASEIGIHPGALAIPTIADADALDREAREACRNGSRDRFFRDYLLAASLARWLPSYGLEVAALQTSAGQLAPTKRPELRRLTIQLLRLPHPDGLPGGRERSLYLATNEFSAQDPVAALQVAKRFFATRQPMDGITQAMHRVQALAALKAGQDYASSAAGLQADLASGVADSQRDLSTRLLTDLNNRLRPAPALAVDASGPVGQWIRSAGLAWYGYAEPADPADAQANGLGAALTDPNVALPPAELLKLQLLAAQDSKRPEDERLRYFRRAVRQLLATAPTYARFDELTGSVADQPAFDLETRSEVLWTALATLAKEGRADDYARWRRDPLAASLAPDFQKKLVVLDLEAAVDRGSAAAIASGADRLGADKIGTYGALALQDFLGALLNLGDLARAEQLERKLAAWQFEAGAAPDANSLQLEFNRRIRLAREADAVHAAFAAALLARFGPGPLSLPASYANVRRSGELSVLRHEDTFAAALYLAQHGQFEHGDFGFWGTVLSVMPASPETAATVGEMLHAGLAAADSDQMRSELMILFFSSADIDDRAVRRALEQEFAAYRDPARNPACYLVDRLYEIHRDLRLGVPVALQTAFADFADPRVRVVRERTCLRAYAEAGDRANLRRTLDEIEPGRLLSAGFITRSIAAFDRLGMQDELRGARDVARRLLRQAVLESWLTHDASVGNTALDLAEALGDSNALPDAWAAELRRAPGDPVFQERIRLVQACLKGDWSEAEAAAAELNQAYPALYTYYWYRGQALHRLGRDREAVAPLTVFARYAKDELEYPEALRLLAAIRSAPSEPATQSAEAQQPEPEKLRRG